MKCKYGTMWLTGTPWMEDCGTVVWDGSQLGEVVPLIDRGTPALNAFGNRTDVLPVPITLEGVNELDALRYCAEIVWLLPASGVLIFEEQRGTNKLTITYPSAMFTNVRRQRLGQSQAVQLVYNFIVTGPPAFELVDDAELIATESGTFITTG